MSVYLFLQSEYAKFSRKYNVKKFCDLPTGLYCLDCGDELDDGDAEAEDLIANIVDCVYRASGVFRWERFTLTHQAKGFQAAGAGCGGGLFGRDKRRFIVATKIRAHLRSSGRADPFRHAVGEERRLSGATLRLPQGGTTKQKATRLTNTKEL